MEPNTNQPNNFVNQNQFTQPQQPSAREGVIGPIIASIIVIAIIVMGGLFFYGSVIERQKNSATPTTQSDSTNTNEMSSDLNSIDTASADADIAELEAEIDAALE